MPDRGDDAAVTEVLALEAARCRAISGQDWEALAAMLSDDLTHTHITGGPRTRPPTSPMCRRTRGGSSVGL